VIVPIHERQPGTAHSTGIWLSVKSSVARVLILALTFRAHGEVRHGRGGTVIGQGTDYGKPRAAVGAVYERVKEAPVLRLKELTETVVANADVRRYEGEPPPPADTFSYLESFIAWFTGLIQEQSFKRANLRQRRSLAEEVVYK
jgi:hypothetical protein